MSPIPWPDPPLSTGEIALRPWREADLPAVVAACSDPLIVRFLPSIPQPYGIAEAQTWLARHEPARRAGAGIELAIAASDRSSEADRLRASHGDPDTVGSAGPVRPDGAADPGPAVGRAGATRSAADEVLGAIALLPIDWERRVGMVGYWLAPAARGRGVVTTALDLLAGWAFDALGLDGLELTADVANAASQRVAARCGFTRETLLRDHLVAPGHRRDSVLYAKPAPA